MKRKKIIEMHLDAIKLWVLMWMMLLLGLTTIQAQCEASNTAFQAGEQVTYRLYFNWKFIWIKAGTATLSIDTTSYQNKPAIKMDLLARSKRGLDFIFKMRDTLTCIMGEKLEPRYFRKGAEEGRHYTVNESWFSYKDGMVFINQKRSYKDEPSVTSSDTSNVCVFDMLSILAQARSYNPDDFEVGQKLLFPMVTGRVVREETLIYRGKEYIKASDEDDTTYRCLVFSFVEYNKKGKEKEVITFYVSDDKNHLPIRLDMFLNIGSAKAYLKTVTGNRHPITSTVP